MSQEDEFTGSGRWLRHRGEGTLSTERRAAVMRHKQSRKRCIERHGEMLKRMRDRTRTVENGMFHHVMLSTLRSQDPRCRMSMIAGMKRPKQRWRSIGVAGEVGCLVAQTDDGQTPGPNLTSVTPRRRAQGTAGQIVSQTDKDSGSTIATAGYKSDHG